jgi:hypothetical protein
MTNTSLHDRNTSDGAFRLLVPKTGLTPPSTHTIELGGIHWVLTEPARIPAAAVAPEYTCISYSWGRGRTANSFDGAQSMSDRTLPAIEVAIKALRPLAIWIDALCVPSRDPARTACLRSMGAVFSSAASVVAVLSNSCSVLLEEIHHGGALDPAVVLLLENDDWVTRAWTYQEIVNSRSTHFVAEGGGGVLVPGNQLLQAVMGAISDYKKAQGVDSFRFRELYPKLDCLEGLIGDYMTSDYLERSAYQVMSAVSPRFSEHPDDYFNAMIGAITTTPLESRDDLPLHPAEHFMRVCEAKGDYSFIYSVAPRGEVPGRCWRPLAGPLAAVLPWHSSGSAQPGCQYPTHLQLNNMCRMIPGTANSDARKLIDWWLQSDNTSSSAGKIADLLLERLRQASFSGCGEHLELESGYFFPQTTLTCADEIVVVVPADVGWTFGAPGLVIRRNGIDDIHNFCGVGVFVGRVPKVGNSINVG